MSIKRRHSTFVLLLLTLLLCTTLAGAADFRGVDWGASHKQVRASEDLPLHHDMEDNIAFWNFKVAGVPAGLLYHFEDDKLVLARYISRHTTPHAEEDHADYLAFQVHFDAELGAHDEEVWIWADGDAHGKAEQTVANITAGKVKIVTRWKNPSPSVDLVELTIAGKKGAIETLDVVFRPKK
jgi:hypothetical protein